MSNREWLSDQLESLEFQRLIEREDFIERYLDRIEALMDENEVPRSELARRMGCSRANITQMFRRAKNLAAESMVDLAFHLGYRIQCRLEPLDRIQYRAPKSLQNWPGERLAGKWNTSPLSIKNPKQSQAELFGPKREHKTGVKAADNSDYALAS